MALLFDLLPRASPVPSTASAHTSRWSRSPRRYAVWGQQTSTAIMTLLLKGAWGTRARRRAADCVCSWFSSLSLSHRLRSKTLACLSCLYFGVEANRCAFIKPILLWQDHTMSLWLWFCPINYTHLPGHVVVVVWIKAGGQSIGQCRPGQTGPQREQSPWTWPHWPHVLNKANGLLFKFKNWTMGL